ELAEALADCDREAVLTLLEYPSQPTTAAQADDSVDLRRVLTFVSRVLGRPLAADQGFASAGGHSLLGVQAIAEWRRLTGRQLRLALLHGDPDDREVVRHSHAADSRASSHCTVTALTLTVQRRGNHCQR
ncbi:hypothetical protein GOY11_34385, partial [Pseudomonas aeruginosa]|uniref:phosphopantetheine-binding protein n=1 Tax=Pseudomonas aeruginosa TaxID=287 RepID=UPI001DF45784